MKRALPLLLALCACSLRAPRVETTSCSSNVQCERTSVCFLGECRRHSSALSLVVAEVRPANDSPLGYVQVPGIDLQQSVVHDFALVAPLAATGEVQQDQDADAGVAPVPGALVTFTDHSPGIPDRAEQISARADNAGSFTARLPQGLWDVLVQPPAPLPPYRLADPLGTSSPQLSFVLPRIGALARYQGTITANGAPLTGAAVTVVDPNGLALSAPAQVAADGGVSILVALQDAGLSLQLGPPADVDAGTPAAALDPLPNYSHLDATSAVDVALPAVATLSGTVVDAAGAPVAAARVYARSDGMQWSLLRSTTAGSDGTYSLTLRAGNYVVEAAPAATDAAGASGELAVSVGTTGATLTIPCPPKIRALGLITDSKGAHVGANFQVIATRLADRLLTTRTGLALPTDSAGIWHVTADPGLYRVEVVPPADSGLPRKIVQLDLDATASPNEVQLPVIQLSPALVVGGTVHGAPPGAADAPVANATVSFYALDTQGRGVLLGTGATDAYGHYNIVLPDVAQPGAFRR